MKRTRGAGFDFFTRLEAAAVASMENRRAAAEYLAHRAAGLGPEDSRACVDAHYADADEDAEMPACPHLAAENWRRR